MISIFSYLIFILNRHKRMNCFQIHKNNYDYCNKNIIDRIINKPLAVYLRKESEYYLGTRNNQLAPIKYFRQSHDPQSNMTIKFVNNNCHSDKNTVYIKIGDRYVCKCGRSLRLCNNNPLKFTIFIMKFGFLIKHKNLCLTRNGCSFNFRTCEQNHYNLQLFNFRPIGHMEDKLNRVKKIMTHSFKPFKKRSHKKCGQNGKFKIGIGPKCKYCTSPQYMNIENDDTYLDKIQTNITDDMRDYGRNSRTAYESGIILNVLSQL